MQAMQDQNNKQMYSIQIYHVRILIIKLQII
jgi:hypothetical protein